MRLHDFDTHRRDITPSGEESALLFVVFVTHDLEAEKDAGKQREHLKHEDDE